MAKKKSAKKAAVKNNTKGKKPANRSARKEPYNGARIEAIVERMREQAARLSGLIKAMADNKLNNIEIDGHAMLLRGLNQVDNFADNASRSLREAKAEGKTR